MSDDEKQTSKGKDRHDPAETSGPEAIDFASFITSLSTAALLYLGEFENPETKQREVNLPYARHHIDLISMLKAKTLGNLTSDEERLVEALLTELRMKYVKASS